MLRYAFRVAETGFDPAQVTDLYSSNIIAQHLRSAAGVRLPRAAGEDACRTPRRRCPRVSADFTHLTFRIRPGIYFQDHPAFKGKQRELVAQDYVYSIKRHYDPRLKSPRIYLLENAEASSA